MTLRAFLEVLGLVARGFWLPIFGFDVLLDVIFFLVKQTRPFLMRKTCSAAGKIIIIEVVFWGGNGASERHRACECWPCFRWKKKQVLFG